MEKVSKKWREMIGVIGDKDMSINKTVIRPTVLYGRVCRRVINKHG